MLLPRLPHTAGLAAEQQRVAFLADDSASGGNRASIRDAGFCRRKGGKAMCANVPQGAVYKTLTLRTRVPIPLGWPFSPARAPHCHPVRNFRLRWPLTER